MNVNYLLLQISDVSKKYDLISQKTGNNFNIFDIANISTDEVKICRVIYELINPRGCHNQGDVYLRLFDQYVLSMGFSEQDFQTAHVYREFVIENNRRIDLVVKTKDKFIPIEVKIYAGDQNAQCHDYSKKVREAKLFYLTLDGHHPSAESTSIINTENETIGCNEVNLISFKTEVLTWINKCLELHETIKIAPIREILLQLASVIRKLTNQTEEGKNMEIVNILSETKENMKAAIDIEKSITICKNNMMIKVLKALEKEINKDKLANQYDYENLDYKLVKGYYSRINPTFPGISFPCKALSKTGVELWLRIEIGHNIFVGFVTPLNGEYHGVQADAQEVQSLIKDLNIKINGWWAYSEDLQAKDSNESPDFKSFNEAYLDLYDDKGFALFIANAVDRINNLFSCCF